MARPLFHGKRGALRLGVTGVKPMESWDDFPPWRCLFIAWMTRVQRPLASGEVYIDDCEHEYHSTKPGAHAKDKRHQFNITLPDEMLERLGVALGMEVLFSRVEVVLTMDASDDSQHDNSHDKPSKDVDAYVVFVESPADAAIARHLFFLHDQQVVARHFHASKWAIRKGDVDRRCEHDVLKKAYDTIVQAEESLTSVDWSESEWVTLAQYELRSLKPTIYAVSVSRDGYIQQVPESRVGRRADPCRAKS
ncbi:hypothetical protein AAVH_26257 [Aphelenchoides avenae]|nr:hypothetical protein AAVH_26257 [Aphelenchus avenae]